MVSETSIDNTEVFDAATQEAYNEAVAEIEQGKKDFKEEFGVDIHDMPAMLKFEIDDTTCALNSNIASLINDNTDNEMASSDEDGSEVYERIIQKMDNKMIRQIESHLAGVPRVSEEFGKDLEYEKDRKRR
jgi:hypothetical protein